MKRDFSRSNRIADQIQRELANLIQFEVKDPRIGMVTITSVEVSRELEYAKIYFTVLGDADVRKTTQEGLTRAAGFLRRELAHRLKLRTTPSLQFLYDESIDRAARMDELISTATASDAAKHVNDD